jgi:uncharacterized protein with HEPN domain
MDNAQQYLQHLNTENNDMTVQAIRDCYVMIAEAAEGLPSESRDRHPEIELVEGDRHAQHRQARALQVQHRHRAARGE